MGNILFKCPQMGFDVQHWLSDDLPEDQSGTYEPVVCKACAKLHFINRSTGKLLGEAER